MLLGAAAVLVLLFVAGASAATTPDAPSPYETVEMMVRRVAQQRGQDPALILAFCQKESSLNPAAFNPNDPSYGLMGINPVPWLEYFGYSPDYTQLYSGEFNVNLGCQIISYFQDRNFRFPDEADIYNVGETLWKKGVRNTAYRAAVKSFYQSYS